MYGENISAAEEAYYETAEYVNILEKSVFIIFVLMALVGNPLTCVVMHRLSSSTCSTCIYVATSAMVDLITVLVICTNKWLKSFDIQLDTLITTYSSEACRLYTMFASYFKHMSNYLAIPLVTEVFIVVLFPTKARKLCSYERARSGILFIATVTLFLDFHWFWSIELYARSEVTENNVERSLQCNYMPKYIDFLESFNLIDFLITKVLPLCYVLGMTLAVTIKVIRQRAWVKLDSIHKKYLIYPAKYCALQKPFFILGLIFIAFAFTDVMISTYTFFAMRLQNSTDFVMYKNLEIGNYVKNVLYYVYLSCKLPVLLVSSLVFRQELKNLVLRACCCNKGSLSAELTKGKTERCMAEHGNISRDNSSQSIADGGHVEEFLV